MVRKTTAVDISDNTTTEKKKTTEDYSFDVEKLFSDAWRGAKENGHLLLGVFALLLGLILLREFLLGMILVTTGILFISGFFKNKQ